MCQDGKTPSMASKRYPHFSDSLVFRPGTCLCIGFHVLLDLLSCASKSYHVLFLSFVLFESSCCGLPEVPLLPKRIFDHHKVVDFHVFVAFASVGALLALFTGTR